MEPLIEQKKSATVKQLFILTKNYLIISALSYFLTIQIANKLGPYQFGIYSYVMLIGSIFSLIITFSTEQTAPLLYSKLKNKIKVNNTIYSIRLFFLGVAILASFIVAIKSLTIAFGALVIALSSLNLSFLYELNGKNIKYSYLFFLERSIYLGVTFLLLTIGILNIQYIFLVLFISVSISLTIQITTNKKVFKHFKFLAWKPLFLSIKNNSYLVLIAFSTFAYGGFSRLIIESKLGMKELGVYSAGWQIIMLITIFQAQVVRTWRLNISKALLNKDYETLKKLIKSYLGLSTFPVIAGTIAMIYISPFITQLLFGEEYAQLSTLLPIFSLYFIVINLDSLASMIWIGLAKQLEYVSINLTATLCLCLFLYLLPEKTPIHYLGLCVIITHGISVTCQLSLAYFKHLKKMAIKVQ